MKLSQVNEILDHKIIDGSEYQWNCWPNARFLDYETEYCHVSVVFNYKTQEIKPYRWLDPRFKDAMVAEAEERKTDHTQAWDNVKWVDLETEEDWLNKAEAISIGTGFDERIEVPLELDQDTITRLALEAHKRDITLNNMVEIILQAAIDQHKVNETIDQNVE